MVGRVGPSPTRSCLGPELRRSRPTRRAARVLTAHGPPSTRHDERAEPPACVKWRGFTNEGPIMTMTCCRAAPTGAERELGRVFAAAMDDNRRITENRLESAPTRNPARCDSQRSRRTGRHARCLAIDHSTGRRNRRTRQPSAGQATRCVPSLRRWCASRSGHCRSRTTAYGV
jgi:hypothetical protein